MKKITFLLAMLIIATSFSQTIITSENFNSGTLPAGWTAYNSFGNGDTEWTFGSNETPGEGATNDFLTNAAIFNDNVASNDGQHDFVYLWNGPYDVSSFTDVTLTYDYALNVLNSNDEFLYISLWDGTNAVWIPIKTYGEDTNPTTDFIDVVAAITANSGIDSTAIYFGFGYNDVDSDQAWGAGIDNVELSGNNPAVVGDSMYIHSATGTNISGNLTVIDHPNLNGNPNAKIVATHNWNENGLLNIKTVGVWYNGSNWTVYNEDLSAMVANVAFNIYIDGNDSNTITHIADAASVGSSVAYTVINDPLVNGDPNATIIIGKYRDANNVYNVDHYGLFYDGSFWNIFNEENNAIPNNAVFNVVLAPSENNVMAIQHQATVSNTSQYWTAIDDALLNNNPDAIITFSHNWGAAGDGSNVSLTDTHSLWYDASVNKWKIFNVDTNINMNTSARFNLLVMETPSALAVSENTLINFTIYPNPVSNVLNILLDKDFKNAEIFNLLGQKVKESNTKQIDVSNLENGVYLIKVTTLLNEFITKRFVKK